MSLQLPKPPQTYDAGDQAQTRALLEANDSGLQRRVQNVEIIKNKLILTAPDGGRWSVTVDNSGNLGTTAL